MTETEFLEKYEQEKPLYNLYGKYLKETILKKAKSSGFDDHNFIIEPSYRTKDNDSIITKAFYRNKNYSDPYNDITDKVGLRFVLLM
jgi:putative GTP pyrophosphokinase